MKRICTLCLLLTLAAIAAHAQSAPSTNATPPPVVALRWDPANPKCERFAVDGSRFRLIRNNGVVVAAYVTEAKDFYAADVIVLNLSDKQVTVDPDDSAFVIWKDMNKQPQVFAPLAPEKVAAKIENHARWGSALRTAVASMATTSQSASTLESGSVSITGTGGRAAGSSATGTYIGSSSTVVTSPDTATRRQAEAENAAAKARAEAKSAALQTVALRANTLLPDKTTGGQIYYPHKSFTVALFAITIEGVRYEFPVGPASK